jgi:hypothetical protein
MPYQCQLCGSPDFDRSHLRLRDIPHLLIFRYPQRCWVCRQRDYFPLLKVLRRWWRSQFREDQDSNFRKA